MVRHNAGEVRGAGSESSENFEIFLQVNVGAIEGCKQKHSRIIFVLKMQLFLPETQFLWDMLW